MAKELTRAGKPWCLIRRVLGSVTLFDLKPLCCMVGIEHIANVEIKVGQLGLRRMSLGLDFTGPYRDVDHLLSRVLRAAAVLRRSDMVAPAPITPPPGDFSVEPSQLLPLWRGRLEWHDRVRPQQWDEEQAGTRIGGTSKYEAHAGSGAVDSGSEQGT